MIFPTYADFKKKLNKGNLIPVWSEFLADFDTLAPATQALIFLPVYALVSVMAALVLHYLVEKPFLLLKDRKRAVPAHISYAN